MRALEMREIQFYKSRTRNSKWNNILQTNITDGLRFKFISWILNVVVKDPQHAMEADEIYLDGNCKFTIKLDQQKKIDTRSFSSVNIRNFQTMTSSQAERKCQQNEKDENLLKWEKSLHYSEVGRKRKTQNMMMGKLTKSEFEGDSTAAASFKFTEPNYNFPFSYLQLFHEIISELE